MRNKNTKKEVELGTETKETKYTIKDVTIAENGLSKVVSVP